MRNSEEALRHLRVHLDHNSGASTGEGSHSPWWSSSHSQDASRHLVSINPSTEAPLGAVCCADHDDYNYVIQQAQKAAKDWRSCPAPKRGEVIRQLGEAFRQHKEVLGCLIAAETGKLLEEGCGEVQEVIDMADLAVGQSRMLYGKTMHSERPSHRLYEQWHPLGVIGVITAFNFPAAVWSWNAFIAAVAGNTVVWKPSSKSPLTAIAIQHICNRVMQANGWGGVFNLVITQANSQTLAKEMVKDKRLSLISFTGSIAGGARVEQSMSERLEDFRQLGRRRLFELSGNNAVIVTASADIKKVLPSVLFGAIGTTGQRCTTIRRVFIHKSVYPLFARHLAAAYKTIKVGDPLTLDPKALSMGPLIDADGVKVFKEAMEALSGLKASVLAGGHVIDRPGYFVEPTLVEAKPDWDLLQQETFAPILYLIPYNTLDEAIAWQNNVPQGLSSAIFTESLEEAEQFLSAHGSDCGIANVNIGTSGAEIGGAFGGEKATGGGREAGSDAWKSYMRRQTVTINWGKDVPLAQGIQFNYASIS